jgi:hypothetical protein
LDNKMTNYIRNQLTRQIANRAGSIIVATNTGGYQYVDSNGSPVAGPSVDSTFLSVPPRVSDPQISAAAVNAAAGNIVGANIPPQLSQSLADVAAYVSVINNVSVHSLFNNGVPTLQLLSGYNTFKPKGSQLGMFGTPGAPIWQSNPILQGTLALTQ